MTDFTKHPEINDYAPHMVRIKGGLKELEDALAQNRKQDAEKLAHQLVRLGGCD